MEGELVCARWQRTDRMTRLPSAYCILLFLMLAAHCSNRDEVMQYATAHAASLVESTRPLWAKYSASPADIPESEYPPDVRALNPDLVTAGKAGVALYIKTSAVHVTGIFIRYDPSFPTPSAAPPDSDEMTYRRLGDDVFWFSRPR